MLRSYTLAEIHLARDKHDPALNCLNETVRVYDLFPEESAEKIVGILELKATTLCDMSDYEAAASVYEECIERLSSLELNENGDGSSTGSAEVCNEQIARLNHKLGLMFAKLGELEEAFESYRRAIQIFTSLGGKDDIRIGEVSSRKQAR